MPIQCLTSIRFSINQDSNSLMVDPRIAHFVEGIYQFNMSDLGNEVALFNDGLPALVFLPKPDLSSACRVQNKVVQLGAIWFAAGSVNQSYWLPPTLADDEKLTIVRFFPSAWSALFGKSAVVHPYIHDLKNYHAELAKYFYEIYEAPTLIEGLVACLVNLCEGQALDKECLTFAQLAIHAKVVDGKVGKEGTASPWAGAHPKWVQRQFKRSLGISPYQFEQLQRFITAYHQIYEDAAPNLHGIADCCGYYDANHLIKDFNKYLGLSPRQYFKDKTA